MPVPIPSFSSGGRSLTGREETPGSHRRGEEAAGEGGEQPLGDGFGGRSGGPGRAAVEQGRPGLAVVAGDHGHLPLLLHRRRRRPRVRPLDHHHRE